MSDALPGVVTIADLPSEPESVETLEAAPDLAPNCSVGVEDMLLVSPYYEYQVVSYNGVEGDRVVSATHIAKPDRTSRDFDALVKGWQDCPASSGKADDGSYMRELDLPNNQFGYTAYASNDSVTGVRAYGLVGDTIVQVTVYHDGDGAPAVDAAALLEKAIERAA